MAVKRKGIVFICIVFLVIAIAGCSGERTGRNSMNLESTPPVVSFDHYVNFDWWTGDHLEDKEYGRWLAQKTGVVVKTSKPLSGDNQKLNVMMRSGDLPDIITLDINDPLLGLLIDNERVQPLNELISQYAPSMLDNMEPEYLQYHKWSDGKNYYLTNFIYTKRTLEQPWFYKIDSEVPVHIIRSDVYEAIGRPDMTTPDGFFQALKQIKKKYPHLTPYYFGNFNKDASFYKLFEFKFNYLMMSQFGLSKYIVHEDQVLSSVRSERFKSFIMFMNKLYTNGLIAPESFVDKSDVMDTKVKQGEAAVFSSSMYYWQPDAQITKVKYDLLPYFKDAHVTKASSGWTATVITKNAKHLDRIIQFFEYLETPEGQTASALGIPGKHWDYDESGWPVRSQAWLETLKENPNAGKESGVGTYMWLEDQYYSIRAIYKEDDFYSSEVKDNWQKVYGPQYDFDPFLGRMDPPGGTAEGTILARLSELANLYYPKMVMAKDEANCLELYGEFMNKSEAAGLAQLENYWTQRYHQFNQ